MDYKTRQELKKLSLEVFGSSSRWQKIMNNGTPRVVTETVAEVVPGTNPGDPDTVRQVEVPVKYDGKGGVYEVQRHTETSVRELMLGMKKKQEELREQIFKAQMEQMAKRAQEELEKKVQNDSAGSAL